jgi:putative ABC transport system permease protein
MGMQLIEGRAFTSDDTAESTKAAVVNEMMARRFWPGEQVLGKRFKLGAPDKNNNPWLVIVGVVRDIKHESMNADARQEFYLPLAQSPQMGMTLVARTTVEPQEMAAALRKEVLAADKDQPVGSVAPIEQLVARSLAPWRFSMLLLGAFAALAILLASVGIYGVISYSVAQRTHEIGVRMALGARASDVLALVIGKGMGLVLVGIVLGLAGAFALTRLMTTMLYEISPTDAPTFVLIPLILAAVALAACAVPARRATKVDPMIALRYE